MGEGDGEGGTQRRPALHCSKCWFLISLTKDKSPKILAACSPASVCPLIPGFPLGNARLK